MEKKFFSIVELAKFLGTKYSNVWLIVKKLDVKYRFKGFRKKEYDIVDFIEKLKQYNPDFYKLNEEKLLSILNEGEEK